MDETQLQFLADHGPSSYDAYRNIQIELTELEYIRAVGIFHVECIHSLNRHIEMLTELRTKLKLVPFNVDYIRMCYDDVSSPLRTYLPGCNRTLLQQDIDRVMTFTYDIISSILHEINMLTHM